MNDRKLEIQAPEILAPAGNKASFLAAIAARADAVYCGLKLFSARMEAKNFTLEEFIALVRLAHKKGIKVFVALNALLKPGDLARARCARNSAPAGHHTAPAAYPSIVHAGEVDADALG